MAEYFRHPRGLLYFDLYWHLGDPAQTLHVLEGDIRGDGPWRVGHGIVKVLGCQGTHAVLASAYQQWQQHLSQGGYPPRPLIEAIARRHGAIAVSISRRDAGAE